MYTSINKGNSDYAQIIKSSQIKEQIAWKQSLEQE